MSIIMQLVTIVFPRLKKIQEEEGGKKKINRWTRYGTVVVALIQSYTVTVYANSIPDAIMIGRVPFALLAMLTITTGTMFLMWLGDQITRRGIGNGISMIIFAGIVARIPGAFWTLISMIQQRTLNPVFVIIVLGLWVVVIGLVIMEQQGQRKIPVHYAKRVIGRRMYGAQNTYLPFTVNPSGVIPVIFASSVLLFPVQIAQSLGSRIEWLSRFAAWLRPNGFAYEVAYALLIIFFAYFYTQVTLNPVEISKNIRENGGSIPGIRSEKMEEYLSRILYRIILPGSLFLAFIAIIPSLVQSLFSFPSAVAYLMGGTSLLILVGVDLDTMSQIEGYLRMHHHDGIVKRGKIRSRNL
jgi:preprotein translocase subunit SecY